MTQKLFPKILLCSLLCLILGGFSGLVTSAEIGTWYAFLQKPSWNPPNYLFGPVWSVLYLLMGAAAAIVWHRGGPGSQYALFIFCIQFLLNLFWTPLFFGFHEIGWALAEILFLWLAIAMSIRAFFKVQKLAAILLIPYLLWVSFATMLNLAIYQLN